MSIKYLNDAWDMPLNSSEKIVLLAIADCANNEGFAYPGYSTLVKKTGMGKATLSKAIKVLKGCGILKADSHSDFGQGKKVNTYTISLRSELPISSDLELIEKIKELRKLNSTPISSHLELRKVQTANQISSDREHEPSFKPSVKQPSDNVGTSIEAPTTSKKAKAKKEPTQSEIDALKVAEYLAKKITSYNSEAKVNPKSWIKDIDKAIRIDNRDPKELCEIIQWIYAEGTFWIPNILSGKALREKYNQLSMQRKANKTNVHPINQPRSQMLAGVRFGNF
jgi:hypothetical protein